MDHPQYQLHLRPALKASEPERTITDMGKRTLRAAGACPACGVGPLRCSLRRTMMFVELVTSDSPPRDLDNPKSPGAAACGACGEHLGRVLVTPDVVTPPRGETMKRSGPRKAATPRKKVARKSA